MDFQFHIVENITNISRYLTLQEICGLLQLNQTIRYSIISKSIISSRIYNNISNFISIIANESSKISNDCETCNINNSKSCKNCKISEDSKILRMMVTSGILYCRDIFKWMIGTVDVNSVCNFNSYITIHISKVEYSRIYKILTSHNDIPQSGIYRTGDRSLISETL